METGERFGLESPRILRIDVDGGVWLKPGAAIAYRGNIHFDRLPTLGAHSLKDAAFRELAPVARAIGKGRLYCGEHGAHIRVIRLRGEAMWVSWQELLAFEESLAFEMSILAHGLSVAAGGLVAVRLSGDGAFALATHGEPLPLAVTPGNPVSTDPHATLAWSGTLSPQMKTDLSWRSVFRHGGDEPFQMYFEGEGEVLVQPFKDAGRLHLDIDPLKQLRALVTGG